MADVRFGAGTFTGILHAASRLIGSSYAKFTSYVQVGNYATSSLPALTTSEKGAMVYDSTTDEIKYWNGTAYVSFLHGRNAIVEEVFGPEEAGGYLKAWDAEVTDRTGGTTSIYTIGLQYVPATGTKALIFRGTGEDVALDLDASSGSFIIPEGMRPIDNATDIREKLRVIYTPTSP